MSDVHKPKLPSDFIVSLSFITNNFEYIHDYLTGANDCFFKMLSSKSYISKNKYAISEKIPLSHLVSTTRSKHNKPVTFKIAEMVHLTDTINFTKRKLILEIAKDCISSTEFCVHK